MNDRSPQSGASRLRYFVPLAVLVIALAGAATAFASGTLESNDSGLDSARDVAERGTLPSTPSTSLPDTTEDRGVATTTITATTNETHAEDQAFVDIPDGSTQTFAAGAAGSVTIARNGSALSVVSVDANAGWGAEVEQGSGPEIEVQFVNATTRIDFNAELEDGAVRIRVHVEEQLADAPAQPGVDNSGPGTVSNETGDDHSGEGPHDDSGSDDHSGSGSDNSGSGSSGSGHGGS